MRRVASKILTAVAAATMGLVVVGQSPASASTVSLKCADLVGLYMDGEIDLGDLVVLLRAAGCRVTINTGILGVATNGGINTAILGQALGSGAVNTGILGKAVVQRS